MLPNAWRHHGDGDNVCDYAAQTDRDCPTPGGITATATRGPAGGEAVLEVLPNAWRHHGDGDS